MTWNVLYATPELSCTHSKNRSSVKDKDGGELRPCEEKDIIIVWWMVKVGKIPMFMTCEHSRELIIQGSCTISELVMWYWQYWFTFFKIGFNYLELGRDGSMFVWFSGTYIFLSAMLYKSKLSEKDEFCNYNLDVDVNPTWLL